MYLLSYPLIIFNIKIVEKTDLPHSDGSVMIYLTGRDGYKIFSVFIQKNLVYSYKRNNYIRTSVIIILCFFKDSINMYTIKLIKHKNDRPHGIVSNYVGMRISMLFSLYNKLMSFYHSLSVY